MYIRTQRGAWILFSGSFAGIGVEKSETEGYDIVVEYLDGREDIIASYDTFDETADVMEEIAERLGDVYRLPRSHS